MLRWTACQDGPVAIRYGKGGECLPFTEEDQESFIPGKWKIIRSGKDVILLATGSMVRIGIRVAELLKDSGLDACLVNCSSVKPLDEDFLKKMNPEIPFFTLEEHMITGGFGEYVAEKCRILRIREPEDCIGVPDRFISHGNHDRLLEDAGLSPVQIADRIIGKVGGKRN